MASALTPRFGLKKPIGGDPAAIGELNDNADLLDEIIPKITYSNSEPEDPQNGDIWLKPIGG